MMNTFSIKVKTNIGGGYMKTYVKIKPKRKNNKFASTILFLLIFLLSVSTIITIQIRAEKRNRQSEDNVTTTSSDDVSEIESTLPQALYNEDTVIAEQTTQETESDESPEMVIRSPIYKLPMNGDIIKEYSMDNLLYSVTMGDWRQHTGIDILCEYGDEISAMSDGTVSDIYNDPEYGSTVLISHDGDIMTKYSSLSICDGIFEGKEIKRGDVIGVVDANPTCEMEDDIHLHLEVSKDNVTINPLTLVNH